MLTIGTASPERQIEKILRVNTGEAELGPLLRGGTHHDPKNAEVLLEVAGEDVARLAADREVPLAAPGAGFGVES